MTTPPKYNLAYICNLIAQNQQLNQILTPPIREDNLASNTNPYLQINPKTGLPYTSFDLNMRRKAEVLRYAPNKQSGQTNSLTKSQKWKQIVSGNYQSESFTPVQTTNLDGSVTTTINGLVVDTTQPSIKIQSCNSNTSTSTPSTSCNVPGPPIQLYYDSSVPLYNYATNNNSSAIINTENTNEYKVVTYKNMASLTSGTPLTNNLLQNSTVPARIATIYVLNPVNKQTVFSLRLPISLYFGGIINAPIPENGLQFTVQLIQQLKLNVLYNQSAITLSNNPTFELPASNPMVSFNVTEFVPTSSGTMAFYASLNIGTIQISNINLATFQGFIYDLQIGGTVVVSGISNVKSLTNYTAGFIANVTTDVAFNCSASFS